MASIGERIIESLGGVTVRSMQTAVSRAYESGFYDGMGNDDPASGDISEGSFGYRKLSSRRGLREFSKVGPDKRLEVSWALWQSSPVAKRVLQLKRDYIVGRGVKPTAIDEELQTVLNNFHKNNHLRKRQRQFVMQMFGFGEQCFSVFVREADGAVAIGYVDPQKIHEVVTHPHNAMERRAVVFRPDETEAEYRVYRIMQQYEVDGRYLYLTHNQVAEDIPDGLPKWEMEMLKEYGRSGYDGDCLYTPVNAVSNQARGVSDLIQVADWIDQADATLFALAEREQYADFFSFDVTLNGATPDVVSERSNKIRSNPPRKGSVNVHNDDESWNIFSPELRQQGSIETFRALLGYILGGVGFPVHWYGFGDDANRATAVAQGVPTEKSLTHDQDEARDMLLVLYEIARDQAIYSGKLIPETDADLSINLDMPQISQKDMKAAVEVMPPLAQSLIAAVDAGWITQETAVRSWAKAMAEFGIDYDPATEMEMIAAAVDGVEIAGAQAENERLAFYLNENHLNGRHAKGVAVSAA